LFVSNISTSDLVGKDDQTKRCVLPLDVVSFPLNQTPCQIQSQASHWFKSQSAGGFLVPNLVVISQLLSKQSIDVKILFVYNPFSNSTDSVTLTNTQNGCLSDRTMKDMGKFVTKRWKGRIGYQMLGNMMVQSYAMKLTPFL